MPAPPVPVPRTDAGADQRQVTTRDLVLGAALLMVLAQLALRAWVLYPSWFYLDDFRLLDDARREGLGRPLLDPYDSQFMPLGRALAWVVSTGGDVDWPLAVTLTLLLQLAASAACAWMLVSLVGVRWGVLAPLGLYLSSTMTLTATTWWAASLNALPLQVAFFCAVATWVRYLRTRRLRWLAATLAVAALAMLAYVKALVLLPLLALLALGWFATGGPVRRVRTVVRRYWPAVLAGAVLGGLYLAYYVTQVPQLTAENDDPLSASLVGRLADTMLARSLTVGLVGGPWRWSDANAPAGLVDAPDWSVHVAWVLLALLASYGALRRRGTGRAWLLLAASTAMSFGLLLVSRAEAVGPVAGLEYRYLADVTCAATLALALASMPLLGADQPSAPREPALLRVGLPRRVLVAGTALVCVSGVVSSVGYASIWHRDNPGERFLRTTQAALAGSVPVPFADTAVPDSVVPGYLFPFNTTKRLLPVVVDNAVFPRVTERLAVLDDDGLPTRAEIDAVTESLPGPKAGCGWEVGAGSLRIPLEATAFDFTWWVRIGYLGTAPDVVRVTIGDQTVDAPVRQGLHDLFVNLTGEVSSVTLGGLEAGSPLCVDEIEVGLAIPGEAW